MPERGGVSKVFHETVGRGISSIREISAAKKLSELPPGDQMPLIVVPYISQLADAKPEKIEAFYGQINDESAARRFGATNLKEFSYWAWRSCGIVDIQMVLKALRGKEFVETTMYLVKKGLRLGGYNLETDTGWYHSALVKLAKEYGIKAETKKFIPPSEIALLIDAQNYVLASIKSKMGGHLLLFYGFKLDQNSKLQGFWYHDPNNFKEGGIDKFISKKDFEKISTRRVVALSPLP